MATGIRTGRGSHLRVRFIVARAAFSAAEPHIVAEIHESHVAGVAQVHELEHISFPASTKFGPEALPANLANIHTNRMNVQNTRVIRQDTYLKYNTISQ